MQLDDINTEVEQYGSFVEGKELEEGIYAIFQSDEIREVEGKFGLQYAFDVLIDNEKRTIATTSKRLLAGLKSVAPLEGKRIFIKRSGTGYDTYYKVEEV
jgi:hypothetical protein